MVLIPEETNQADEEDDEEEEGETTSNEWRDMEAERRQFWSGADAVYNNYCERMLFFDRSSSQQLLEIAGAVILTKMDGHVAGGGALSAVAAAKAPVIFTETGENMDEFEAFDLKPFARCLLGMGDESGLMDKNVQEVAQQLRHMLGPMTQIFSMLPGCVHELMPNPVSMPEPLGLDKESLEMFKRCTPVLDSMTEEELNGSKPLTESRIMRIARGSGRHVRT